MYWLGTQKFCLKNCTLTPINAIIIMDKSVFLVESDFAEHARFLHLSVFAKSTAILLRGFGNPDSFTHMKQCQITAQQITCSLNRDGEKEVKVKFEYIYELSELFFYHSGLDNCSRQGPGNACHCRSEAAFFLWDNWSSYDGHAAWCCSLSGGTARRGQALSGPRLPLS